MLGNSAIVIADSTMSAQDIMFAAQSLNAKLARFGVLP